MLLRMYPASEKLWPRIYPLEKSNVLPETADTPMIRVYSVNTVPAPAPPNLASQSVVLCQPLKVILLAISSLWLWLVEEGWY